jgi:anti-anti-sigma regulatory factor
MLDLQKNISEDGALVIRLAGAATIEQAESLRQLLLDTVEQGAQEQKAIRINCGQVTEIDSFILQMLCSAHRTCISRQILLTWDGPPSAPVKEVIRHAGFLRSAGCSLCPDDQRCLWCDK